MVLPVICPKCKKVVSTSIYLQMNMKEIKENGGFYCPECNAKVVEITDIENKLKK